jgi:hypothetical protein
MPRQPWAVQNRGPLESGAFGAEQEAPGRRPAGGRFEAPIHRLGELLFPQARIPGPISPLRLLSERVRGRGTFVGPGGHAERDVTALLPVAHSYKLGPNGDFAGRRAALIQIGLRMLGRSERPNLALRGPDGGETDRAFGARGPPVSNRKL